jgi:hypothetical protein
MPARVLLPASKHSAFPNLDANNHRVTSEATAIYNCVGWAAIADTSQWWQAGNAPGFFWPHGVPMDESLAAYEKLFESLGYKACDNDSVEVSFEKIALYADADGFTHVAYQLFSGWTSKLGGWEDIRHRSLAALEGHYYGAVSRIMKRRCGIRGYAARLLFNATARLWPVR